MLTKQVIPVSTYCCLKRNGDKLAAQERLFHANLWQASCPRADTPGADGNELSCAPSRSGPGTPGESE